MYTECGAGQRLDYTTGTGCEDCPADHWSGPGKASCTACTVGKGVATGQGKQASDCLWS